MTVVILLCFQTLAQSVKHRVALNPAPPQSTPEPVQPKPEVSKEFMVLGRKAFTAVDRLNEHLLDTKTLISRGTMMELSDEKESWMLRETASEKACDDVLAEAETPLEKNIAQVVRDAALAIQRNHELIERDTEVAVRDGNLNEIRLEQEGVQGPFLASGHALDITHVEHIAQNAILLATIATRALLSSSCYLGVKEAVSTGVFDSDGKCESAARKAGGTGEAPEASQLKSAVAKQLTEAGIAARADGQTLIWTVDLPSAFTAETFAARFHERIVEPEYPRATLRSVGLLQIRLETGGKTFDWLVQ